MNLLNRDALIIIKVLMLFIKKQESITPPELTEYLKQNCDIKYSYVGGIFYDILDEITTMSINQFGMNVPPITVIVKPVSFYNKKAENTFQLKGFDAHLKQSPGFLNSCEKKEKIKIYDNILSDLYKYWQDNNELYNSIITTIDNDLLNNYLYDIKLNKNITMLQIRESIKLWKYGLEKNKHKHKSLLI